MVCKNLIWTTMMMRMMVLSCSARDSGTFTTQVIAWTRTSRMKMVMILKILKTWLSNQRMQSLFVHATRMNLVTSRFGYWMKQVMVIQTYTFTMRFSSQHFPFAQHGLIVHLKGEKKIPASPVYSQFLGSLPFFETSGFNVAVKFESGNFIAVGSMEPAIEIWNLDIIDEVQPAVVLGGTEEKKKKKGKNVSIKYKEGSHTDSVLGLAWNKHFRNILASASADKQVKIWDVQAVAWNHHEPQVLLSGSFDRSVVMKDGRLPSDPGFKWSVTADVESLAWDPHDKHLFVVSLEDGTVQGFDIRAAKSGSASDLKPSFTLHAHDKAVCTISYNPLTSNVKLWDLSNNQPSCLVSKNPKAGAIFSVSFSEDNPFLLAIGGSKGTLELWDTLSEAEVARRFGTTTS
ncbi:hypothetical protein NC653_019038 [Populus alba x Populus x berolinensis]|uniref:Transducin family protein n=1 Tax=Populus alba x Populus x berolinensis TaxID=444605 RepID=A0AAD6QHT2_9ROSI|nr:hypothetical protein NC653_019038 [Populus alba x Populus x berolinensis]